MIERLYTFAAAAKRLDPTGQAITARSLRTEHDKGRLRARRIAGKLLVTDSDLDRLLEESAECHGPESLRRNQDTS